MYKATIIKTAGRMPGVAQLLRWAASRYREGSIVHVRSGLAKGLKWRRSHVYVNGFWLGHFELDVQSAIERMLWDGASFFDLGANAGFFSLGAARRVGPKGKCVSVDPDPVNCANIRELIQLNHFETWQVIQKAVAEAPGVLQFAVASPGSSTGHLVTSPEGGDSYDVEVATLDEICRVHGQPDLIKMDIEGAEVRALQGAAETLALRKAVWLIELHSEQIAVDAREILKKAGYRFEKISGEPIPDDQPLDHHIIARPL